ncbi:hypothetical protein RB199_27585 [Streptomyces libani]
MNGFTPAIDTCEIADNELDNIAGGLASAGAEVAGHGAAVSVGGVVETAGSLASSLARRPGHRCGHGGDHRLLRAADRG